MAAEHIDSMGEGVSCGGAPRNQLGKGFGLELCIRKRTSSVRISGLEEVE